MKLSAEQREQLARAIRAAWCKAELSEDEWGVVPEYARKDWMGGADAAFAYLLPIIAGEALKEPSDKEIEDSQPLPKRAMWGFDSYGRVHKIFANRLAAITAPPVDKAVEQVAQILESDKGGLSRKIAAQIVAAVRAADKEQA